MTEKNKQGDESRPAVESRPRSAEGRRIEDRYRSLFTECPVSLWEEDLTELLAHLDRLRGQGIADLRSFLVEHPEEVVRCVGLVRIVAVNRSTLDLFEAPDEQSLLADLAAVFTEQSLAAFREIVVALAEGQQQFVTEAVNRTLRGRELSVRLRWSLLPDREGRLTRALISIEDLTEQKRAHAALLESEANFREFVLAQPDPIQVLAPDGTIIVCNKSAAAAFGSTAAAMIGRNAFDGMPPEMAEKRRALLERVTTGKQPFVFSEQFQGRFYETVLSPIVGPEGGVSKVAVLPHDITQLKETENELRESRHYLETVIGAAPS